MGRKRDEDTSGAIEREIGAHPGLWGGVVLPLGVGICCGARQGWPVYEEDVSGHEGMDGGGREGEKTWAAYIGWGM